MRLVEQQHDPQRPSGMGGMVVVSAVLHVAIIVFILVAASREASESGPRVVSHTVELVSPGVLGPAGGGDGAKSGSNARLPAEKNSPLPKPERKEPIVKRPVAPVQEKPERVQAKEPPALKPPQARKAVEPPKPKEPPPPKAKEEPKVVAAKPPTPEPPAAQPKLVAPAKPKEAVKLPEKIKQTELKQPKKTENKPEPEKVVKKTETSPIEKEKPQTKSPPIDKSQPEKKPKETADKALSPSASRAQEQKAEEREAGEARERERQILAAVEKVRADEEVARREHEIVAALERVRKGETERANGKGDEGTTSREAPDSSAHERQGNAMGESGGGGGGHGAEFIAYTQHIKQKVKDAWILAERKPGLRAVVRFGVEPNGEVMEAELADSSGDQAFDQSALRAVRKASPFPSPPEAYREEFTTQKVEITFSGEERIR